MSLSQEELQKVKGLSPEEFATRSALVAALPHRIQSVPDGTSGGGANQNAGWSGSNARTGIQFDPSGCFQAVSMRVRDAEDETGSRSGYHF